jgi:hypothetical protein
MARVPAKIVPLLDVSYSMVHSNYLTPAKVALDTFVNMFQIGDLFCILSFSDSVYNVYPSTRTLTTYTDPAVMLAASNAIKAVQAVDNTNIGDAIIAATNLLNPQPVPRAIVLLSDGNWNMGPDPLKVLPANIPIYTIALGNNGQLDLLRAIATRTQGQYFFSPDAIALASIYFDILEQAKVGQVATNGFRTLTPTRSLSQVVQMEPSLPSASIGVNWADPGIGYGGTSGNRVATKILDPDFKPYTGPVTYDQYGFAVVNVPNPKPGSWYVTTSYAGTSSANVTGAGLLASSRTSLALDFPAEAVPAGQPFIIRARVLHEDRPLKSDLHVHAAASVPSVTMEEALQQHASSLANVELPQGVDASDPNAGRIRLNLLRAQQAPYVELLPRHRVIGKTQRAGDDAYEVQVDTSKPGEYNVRVEVAGPHPAGGEFTRSRLVTVSVR